MSTADVIVLSSTERPSTYTPRPAVYATDNLFELSPRCSSPLSLMSPSELIETASRSKYFETPSRTGASSKRKNKGTRKETGKEDSSTAKGNDDRGEEKPKRRRKKPANEPQTATEDLEPSNNASKKTSKPRKPRANNTKRGESGNKTLKGKVAKTGNARVEGEAKGTTVSDSSEAVGQKDWEKDGLQLEEAVKRRLDWTPPKEMSKPVIELDDGCSPEGIRESAGTRGFGGLLSAYNFSGTAADSPRDSPQLTVDGGPTKRRRIELVSHEVPKSSKSNLHGKTSVEEDTQPLEEKPKKQNKRMNTLTARVTARYIADDMDDGTATEDIETGNSKASRRGKSKPKTKEPEFEILSPKAATKAVEDQDLVFGTCSQLEREDSPTTLRDTQMAIRASESSMFRERQSQGSRGATSSLQSASVVARLTAPRELWSVAARDQDGSLVEAEALDVFDLSDASNASSKSESFSAKERERKQWGVSLETGGKVDFKPSGASEKKTTTESSGVASRPPIPQYGGFTDAELRSQISAYGFKPLKSRQKMIDLLQKCWESKHGADTHGGSTLKPASARSEDTGAKAQTTKSRAKTQTPVSSTSTSSTTTRKTTASRRKPASKKDPKPPTAPLGVEEIEDSEDEALPSPRRLPRTTPTPTQSLPISTVPSPVRGSSAAATHPSSKRTSLSELGTQITEAVRAQPRALASSSRPHPSWHEKILMYDPIILEDFATWLNTEGLGLIGEDREVGTGLVREWCESKGICCCWRKGDGLS